jgi:RimJ/RimL family protein N-acetyltransferase
MGNNNVKSRGRIRCLDKYGRPFEVGECGFGDQSCLADMYEVFLPKPASQGLPPPEPETCQRWLSSLLEIAVNLLAWKDDKVVGHAVLIKDHRSPSGEFVIFVHQDYRNLAIGTELARLTMERAKNMEWKSVWLTVAVTNFIAVKLYRKLGFEYSDMDDCERTMILKL